MDSLRTVHSVCSLDCPDSCGVLVTVQTAPGPDGASSERAIKIQGDPTHPVTRGFLCGKVAKMLDRVYAPDRLLYPMRRRPGIPKSPLAPGRELEAFERISWDQALDEIATRLQSISDAFGPESILPYSYAGTIGQLGYGSMDRRFFYRLGASQLDRTICSTAGGQALLDVYGIRLGTAPQDFAHASLIIAWGANIHGNNIHLWPFIEEARRKGARLIVIDPYRTRTAALADQHLAINPGTDTLLALSLMHVIFCESLEDREYLATCTNGAAELRAHALNLDHSPANVAAITGIPADTIIQLARAYATSSAAAIRLNYGIQRSENGGTAARAVAMLPLITGSWTRRGGGLMLSTSGSFPFNTKALQMPELMLQSPLGRPARTINMTELGQALTEVGVNGNPGPPVNALFVYNSNAAAVAPNQNAVLAGLRRDDLFTVVHDQFFTDTADYADILLPAPTFLETKDVHGAYGHLFAQINSQPLQPLGEVRNNVRLFAELAHRMGFTEPCFDDREDALIDQALSSNHSWFNGITRERLEREGHIPLALPTAPDGQAALPFSTPDWFRTSHGRAELLPVPQFRAPTESRAHATPQYPLEFLPRKADNFMNSTFANQPGHQRMENASAAILEIHADDAASRKIAPNSLVEIFNDRGRIVLRAKISPKVNKGVVAARLDWAKLGNDLSGRGANVNALTSERLTDIGGGATFYSTLVEVRSFQPAPAS
jgi:anaerobic selenocysteine-containing dehydrogenase